MLEPYLELLRTRDAAQLAEPMLATLDGYEVTVDDWALTKLDLVLRGEPQDGETARLVADSIALLTKYAEDLPRLASADEAGQPRSAETEAELMLNAAIGMALVKQIQRVIDGLLKEGCIQEARPLSRFHHTLRNAAFDARKRIDEGRRERLEHLANDLAGSVAGETAIESDDVPAVGNQGGSTQSRSTVFKRAIRRNRPTLVLEAAQIPTLTELLTGLLFVVGAVWLSIVVYQEKGTAGPPEPRPSVLAALESQWQFEFRHPAAYAHVEESIWSALNPAERQALLDGVSRAIGAVGYTGLYLTSVEGKPLARWDAIEGATELVATEPPKAGWTKS